MKLAIAPQPSAIAPSNQNQRRSATSRRGTLVAESAQDRLPPIWEPTQQGSLLTSNDVLHTTPPKGTVSSEIEHALIAIIMRPIADHETHQTSNDNRERELRCYFGSLSPIEAFALRKRLDADRDDDKVAVAFRRLLSDRRHRLRAFLADPRRGRM